MEKIEALREFLKANGYILSPLGEGRGNPLWKRPVTAAEHYHLKKARKAAEAAGEEFSTWDWCEANLKLEVE